MAGSTRSASAAVSVRNCSCTATNTSGRASPARTRALSGAETAGLADWISMARTGGPGGFAVSLRLPYERA